MIDYRHSRQSQTGVTHILTHHFTTPAWFEIQKRHILKYTNQEKTPYKVWVGKYNLELPEDFELPEHWELIDLDILYPKEDKNEHYLQMEWMYRNCVRKHMRDNDIIIFMDSDAFPCNSSWLPLICYGFNSKKCDVFYLHEAPRNPEYGKYDAHPDLFFFASTRKIWEGNNLEWFIDHTNREHSNPGHGLYDKIVESDLMVTSMIRTNVFNAHNAMFGVYGNMIYHQTCGSRAIIGRPLATAGAKSNNNRQCYTGIDIILRGPILTLVNDPINDVFRLGIIPGECSYVDFETQCSDIVSTNTEIFDVIYNKLYKDKDCTFVNRYFLGVPSQ